jgi:hypothetical protein
MTTEQDARRAFSALTLEERLADVCSGCGQHTVKDGKCELCGRERSRTQVFVGETRIA